MVISPWRPHTFAEQIAPAHINIAIAQLSPSLAVMCFVSLSGELIHLGHTYKL